MQRLLGQKTAACFQRCVGMDAANAVYSTTFETDEACGTKYHENFVKFWTDVQNNDWGVDGAMTDVKGDRVCLRPSRRIPTCSCTLSSAPLTAFTLPARRRTKPAI